MTKYLSKAVDIGREDRSFSRVPRFVSFPKLGWG